MKTNIKSWNKGWQVFILFVILVLQMFFSKNVFAEEADFILEEELEKIKEQTKIEENIDYVEQEVEQQEEEIIEEEEEIIEEEEEIVEEEENSEITKEEIWNQYSEQMEFSENKVVFSIEANQDVTIEEILNHISIEDLKESYNVLDIYIIDTEGTILDNTSYVTGMNHIVFLGEDYIKQYALELMVDYTQDGIVNTEDIDSALDTNLNQPEKIPTEVISYIDSLVKDNTSEEPTVEEEFVESKLEIVQDDHYVEEEIILTYSITNLEENYINTISGEIMYDKDSLELVNTYVSVEEEVKGGINDQYFIYLLNQYKEKDPLLVFIFRAKREGIYQVTLQNIKLAMNGFLLTNTNNISTDILVQEYGKGGDIQPKPLPNPTPIIKEKPIQPTTTNKIHSSTIITTHQEPIITATEIYLSNDNYMNELIIDGYSINFDKNQTLYQLDIFEDIDKLDFNISLANENATYFISGNENFKEGLNHVILTVQAEDGSTRDYTIEVKKEVNKNKKVNKNNKIKSQKKLAYSKEQINDLISMIVLIILIISILFVIRYIYLFIKKED